MNERLHGAGSTRQSGSTRFTFSAVSEARPGRKWRALVKRHRASYERWFLSEGDAARPTYLASRRKLGEHMPELLGVYDTLCELAGGGDLVARLLSLYCPPAYVSGCSQAVWPGDEPFLARNYDYSPALLEGTILLSAWRRRKVLAMLDGLWGVVDGINDVGLAVSLTFGGRTTVGEGFGMPLILRYVLETCETTAEAVAALRRVPSHMSYNITVLDEEGHFCTVFVSPDRAPVVRQIPVTTNHQGNVEWHRHARATATLERERFLNFRLADSDEQPDSFIECFLRPPLYNTDYARGFGTLYTAVYWPQRRAARYLWPGIAWELSIEAFREGTRSVSYRSG